MRKRGIPDDLVSEPPIPCDFKVGDAVIFTNDYGVEFDLRVVGFASEPHTDCDDPRFVYLDSSCWWFSVKASSLRKRTFAKGTGSW